MEGKQPDKSIPPQHTGVAINAEDVVVFENVFDAATFFDTVKQRLMNVNHWHDFAGQAGATFQLVDENGQPADRTVQKGDYFKIDIPGPGTVEGHGYDWVQVEEVKQVSEPDFETVAIRVRPAADPQNHSDDVAHFFSEESTSTFTATREGNKITASIHDRNAKPNVETGNWIDKARNTSVAAGAMAGFAKIQWKSLVTGILRKDGD